MGVGLPLRILLAGTCSSPDRSEPKSVRFLNIASSQVNKPDDSVCANVAMAVSSPSPAETAFRQLGIYTPCVTWYDGPGTYCIAALLPTGQRRRTEQAARCWLYAAVAGGCMFAGCWAGGRRRAGPWCSGFRRPPWRALTPARRMDFYRQLGTAPLDQAEEVLRRWWCEAMLDADPRAERIYQTAVSGARIPAGHADHAGRAGQQFAGQPLRERDLVDDAGGTHPQVLAGTVGGPGGGRDHGQRLPGVPWRR